MKKLIVKIYIYICHIMESKNISEQINDLIKSNKLYSFGLELNNTDNLERKNKLVEIMKIYENKSIENKRDDFFDKLDKQIYKQKWTKLQNFHKIIKIKEYVNENYDQHEQNYITYYF